ncbi:hypothetical protein CsatA_012104 [Cannabis sativa]
MRSLTVNYWATSTMFMGSATNPPHCISSTFIGGGTFKVRHYVQKALYPRFHKGFTSNPRAFARRNSVKKLKKNGKPLGGVADISSKDEYGQEDDTKLDPSDSSAAQKLNMVPSRGTVLQACAVTSGLIAAFGVVLRQVSHLASTEGLPILDCSSKVSFDFEMWHLQLLTGLVVVISSSRYLLLKTWPDFAQSSEAANRQELLFRGALLPLFGFDWKSVFVVAALFGVLHIGGGRKYSFAVWATFVGLMYGYATIFSSSLIVPMASHALNNLVGGIIWRYENQSSSSDQK